MYIITSKTKSKMKRNPIDRAKLQDECKHYFKEQGIENIKSLKGKNIEQAYEELKGAGSFIKENLEMQKELSLKAKEKKKKDTRMERMTKAVKMYEKNKEAKLKAEAKKRRIEL